MPASRWLGWRKADEVTRSSCDLCLDHDPRASADLYANLQRAEQELTAARVTVLWRNATGAPSHERLLHRYTPVFAITRFARQASAPG